MKILKPRFWDKKGILSILLLPLAMIYGSALFLRKKIIKSKLFDIPIVCVGNIYIGGTGKTPISIFIARELSKLKKNPVILRKFYQNHNDEYVLLKKYFKNLIISKNRVQGIIEAKKSKFDCVILDDGFQDYTIEKKLSIICFNQKQLIGNGLVIPAGPLGEKLENLRHAQIVLINGKKDEDFENFILKLNNKLEIYYFNYKPINANEFHGKKLLAIAGIGNPENFFDILLEEGLHIEKRVILPDHFKPSESEMITIIDEARKNNFQVITTEKDYLRIKDYGLDEINYLKTELILINSSKLIKKIISVYD